MLVMVLSTLGSRITDCELILGQPGPPRELLSFVPDLGKWGVARHGACQALERHFFDMVDQAGLYRRPSFQAYGILMLACVLSKGKCRRHRDR